MKRNRHWLKYLSLRKIIAHHIGPNKRPTNAIRGLAELLCGLFNLEENPRGQEASEAFITFSV